MTTWVEQLSDEDLELLQKLQRPHTLAELARQFKQPVVEIEDSLRRIQRIGLAASFKGQHVITGKGREILESFELN